jgi:hypothetical protein
VACLGNGHEGKVLTFVPVAADRLTTRDSWIVYIVCLPWLCPEISAARDYQTFHPSLLSLRPIFRIELPSIHNDGNLSIQQTLIVVAIVDEVIRSECVRNSLALHLKYWGLGTVCYMDHSVNLSDLIRNCEVVNYHLLFRVPVLTENTRIIREHITRHRCEVGHDLVARCFTQKKISCCILLAFLIKSGNLVQVGVIKHV